ncbi:hypothetical protein EG850_10050 [Gulosibacter macacae]|uniref:Uncharacterized protein n=1 Tax=Gulosibacter macacae TaxID=2488791 RepID=A0A3P3VX84_9MICO|nr:hypothetical protein [Gulosibacter macacae]RRJ86059.1 hypothetical protein EG850_10050 [Gulosibacter macacae]
MSEGIKGIPAATDGLGVKLAYGERIELGNEQVVPVAMWAGGGGQGVDDHNQSGSGFGGVSVPVGVYVSDAYGVRFRPNLIALVCAVTPLVWVTSRAVIRLIKTLKR